MPSTTSDKYSSEPPKNSEVDLLELLVEIIDHRVMIACTTFLISFFAGIYVFTVTPIYQADALLQIEAKQNDSLLKSFSFLGTNLSPDVTPEIMLLKSRMILGEIVDELKLTYQVKLRTVPFLGLLLESLRNRKPNDIKIDVLHIPLLEGKPQELVLTVLDKGHFRITGETVDAKGQVGKMLTKGGISLLVASLSAAPGTQYSLSTVTKLEAINSLQKRLTVTESQKQSGIIALTLTGDDPVKIAAILNAIAKNYLSQNIGRQKDRYSHSLTFLQHQLPKISSELDEAEARLNAYREQRDSVDLSLEAKSVLDQVVKVENQLNELTFREAEISKRFKKEHPIYRALQEQRQMLEHERARLNNRVSSMPSTQQEILRLSRAVESGRTIYLQLLTRQQELNLSRSSEIGNVRIIDSAVTLPDPISPRKEAIIVLAVLLGGLLSTSWVLLCSAFKRGIISSEQLEVYGMSVLATLPRSVWLWKKTHQRKKHLFTLRGKQSTSNVPFLPVDQPVDTFVEAVRGLRTSLHFTVMDATNQIIVISSPTQDCGKTLVSTSLAFIAAQSGQRVLFIDADMHKGYVHSIFKLSNEHGLSTVLEGGEWQDSVQSFERGCFDVLTCGPQPLNPVESLMNKRFQEVIESINKLYDIVVIDTPPVLAVTDTLLIARVAATTLLVTRYGKTTEKEVENSLKRLQQTGVQVSGTILNDIVKSAALNYRSGYSHYGYGYTRD